MPGTPFPEAPDQPPWGACKVCGCAVKLDEDGRLAEHRYRELLIGDKCRGSGSEPWDYRR